MADRVFVENPLCPGTSRAVDDASFEAMRRTVLRVRPKRSPGMTYEEMSGAVNAHRSNDVVPGGARAGWWLKCVQLDLEAKAIVVREKTRPLRWRRSVTEPPRGPSPERGAMRLDAPHRQG